VIFSLGIFSSSSVPNLLTGLTPPADSLLPRPSFPYERGDGLELTGDFTLVIRLLIFELDYNLRNYLKLISIESSLLAVKAAF